MLYYASFLIPPPPYLLIRALQRTGAAVKILRSTVVPLEAVLFLFWDGTTYRRTSRTDPFSVFHTRLLKKRILAETGDDVTRIAAVFASKAHIEHLALHAHFVRRWSVQGNLRSETSILTENVARRPKAIFFAGYGRICSWTDSHCGPVALENALLSECCPVLAICEFQRKEIDKTMRSLRPKYSGNVDICLLISYISLLFLKVKPKLLAAAILMEFTHRIITYRMRAPTSRQSKMCLHKMADL